MELVKRVELPGAPSSYHIVNGFQEEGKGGNVSVIIAKHRDGGGREKLETVFKNLMTTRQGKERSGSEEDRHVKGVAERHPCSSVCVAGGVQLAGGRNRRPASISMRVTIALIGLAHGPVVERNQQS